MKMYRSICLALSLCFVFSQYVLAQGTPPGQTAQPYAAKIIKAKGTDLTSTPGDGTIKITIIGKTTGIDPHAPESTYLRFLYYAPAGTENWSEFAMNKTDQEAPAAHLDQPVEASLIANLPPPPAHVWQETSKTFRVKLVLKEYTLGQFNQVRWVERVVNVGNVTIKRVFPILGNDWVIVDYAEDTSPPPPDPAP